MKPKKGNALKVKRKLQISSLHAALSNVALFKGMKEKEFREQIYITYQRQGTFLEAVSEEVWEEAANHVYRFLDNKAINMFTEGYPREVYEELIDYDLKVMQREMGQEGEEVPYINVIHYQRLRKSCEFMHKEGYLEPLQEWEHTYELHPNFAFLMVEPIAKLGSVKRRIIGLIERKRVTPITKQPAPLEEVLELKPKHLFYFKFDPLYGLLLTDPHIDLYLLPGGLEVSRLEPTHDNKKLWEKLLALAQTTLSTKLLH
jgi:hypothetical protein